MHIVTDAVELESLSMLVCHKASLHSYGLVGNDSVEKGARWLTKVVAMHWNTFEDSLNQCLETSLGYLAFFKAHLLHC